MSQTCFDKVVGVTFGECQKNIAQIKNHEDLQLIPEPENPYDADAVRVECSGKKIGYVKRGGWLSQYIKKSGKMPRANVYQVNGGVNGLSYGVTMRVLIED